MQYQYKNQNVFNRCYIQFYQKHMDIHRYLKKKYFKKEFKIIQLVKLFILWRKIFNKNFHFNN